MNRTLIATAMCAVALLTVSPLRAATILPGVGGTIFKDANSDGSATPGEGVSGVTVRVYLDNGDGVFNPAEDMQVGADVVTGADGMYCFDSLAGDAGYFVERPAQIVMGTPLAGQVSGLLKPGVPTMLIDGFTNTQMVKANSMTPVATSTSADPGAGILGGERDMYVQLTAGIGEVQLRSNAFGVQILQYDTSSGVIGRAIITWDGKDMLATPTPSLGLGNIDLTSGGLATGIHMRIGVDASGAGETAKIRIFKDDPSVYSEGSVLIPVTDGTAEADAFVAFSDFVGPVSPTDVNAIQLIVGGMRKSIDAQIGQIGTLGPVVQDFLVPEPSSALLALLGLGAVLATRRRR